MKKEIPKYKQLLDWIIAELKTGNYKTGQRFYSENELTKKFNLNRQTVRQAVGILEEQGILDRKKGSGTFVALSIKKRFVTKKIGMISTYQESYIFPSIIKGVDSVLSDSGYSLQLSLTHNKLENESRGLLSMLEQRIDGIIVEPTKSGLPNPNKKLYDKIRNQGIPLIFFNAYYPDMTFPYVSMDDFAVGKAATSYLIEKGHKEIAGIFQGDDLQGHLRYSGYIDAFNKAGLSVNSRRIMWFTTEDIHNFVEDFSRVIRYTKDSTAIFCYNDQISYLITKEFQKRGLNVPEDISIIGVDHSEYAKMSDIPLTSIAHPMFKLGTTVATNLLALLQNPTTDATIKFPPIIIEGGSVKSI